MLSFIDFGNAFIPVFLNVLDIELEEDSDIDESEEFNAGVQIHLASAGEYKEFIVMDINLSTIRNDGEEHPYKEDDLYLELNNVGYYSIIQINCIYNYYAFYLGFKTTNNFFPKTMFRFIKRAYTFEKTEYQILITRTAMYRTFILSPEHPPIYMKERAMLEGCQEPSCLEYYFEKAKEWYRNHNKNDDTTTIQNQLKKVKFYKNVKEVKKKKNNNSLKKVRVKILAENVRKQEKQIKDIANIYIRRIIKDLGDKAFKYYIYVEHYDAALDLVRGLGLEKTLNMIFSKESRISKKYLTQKDKRGV